LTQSEDQNLSNLDNLVIEKKDLNHTDESIKYNSSKAAAPKVNQDKPQYE
jgi:hypothetical protein